MYFENENCNQHWSCRLLNTEHNKNTAKYYKSKYK